MNDVKLMKVAGEKPITVEDIKDLLITYNIGKKPLAKLLGWGETTIIRYIEGDIPTTEYSRKLKMIQCDPNYYYKLLSENEDKLTNIAYKKSKRAVLDVIMKSRIKLVAQYIVNRANGDITARMVQSVLFYSQAVSLAIYEEPLFDTECQLTYNTMPYLTLYDCMRKHGMKIIEIEKSALTSKEREVIDYVYDTFEWFGPKLIRGINQLEMNEHEMDQFKQTNKIVPKKFIKEAYQEMFSRYRVKKVSEFPTYVHSRIQEMLQVEERPKIMVAK